MGIMLSSFLLHCLRMFDNDDMDDIKQDDWVIFITFIASILVPFIFYMFGKNKEYSPLNTTLSAGEEGRELTYLSASMLIFNFPLLPMLAGVVGDIHPTCDKNGDATYTTSNTSTKFEFARWSVITYLAAMIIGQTMHSSKTTVSSFLYHFVIAAIACGLYSLTSSACLL